MVERKIAGQIKHYCGKFPVVTLTGVRQCGKSTLLRFLMPDYEYVSLEDPETVLLIDAWKDQETIDKHHASEMMKTIADLRNKYDLHMEVNRYVEDEQGVSAKDQSFIRK